MKEANTLDTLKSFKTFFTSINSKQLTNVNMYGMARAQQELRGMSMLIKEIKKAIETDNRAKVVELKQTIIDKLKSRINDIKQKQKSKSKDGGKASMYNDVSSNFADRLW